MKHNHIHIIGLTEGDEKERGIENLFEKILTENVSNLVREKSSPGKQRLPIKMNPKRPTGRYLTIKMAKFKDKGRVLKAAREKQLVTYNRSLIKLSVDFSTETLQARSDWHKYTK